VSIEEYFVEQFNKHPEKFIEKLLEHVNDGYINMRTNKIYPELAIFNYTPQTTYERIWNVYTMISRGLVLDMVNEKIKALPFAKFFNYGELEDTSLKHLSDSEPDMKYEVFNKLDGSLGIGFFHKGNWIWATRGTFVSEQAQFANSFIRNKYTEDELEHYSFEYDNMTMIGEIIMPSNRIVVDYGDREEIVLLSMRRNKDGKEIPYDCLETEANYLNLNVVHKYNTIKSLSKLMKEREEWDSNVEGVVIKYENGKRLKIKGEEYLKIHSLMYNVSTKKFVRNWADDELDELIKLIPEEFRKDYEEKRNLLERKFLQLKKGILTIEEYLYKYNVQRPDVSKFIDGKFKDYIPLKHCVFRSLDNRNYDNLIKEYIYQNYREVLDE